MHLLRPEALTRIFPVLVAAFILYSQVVWQPVVGLADNGDWVNVAAPLNLAPVKESESDRFFIHVVPEWRVHPERQNAFIRLITSEWLLVYPAFWLVTPFTGGIFDLRWAGAIHAAVFLWALWLITPVVCKLGGYAQLTIWAAILLALCDVAYFSIFNSFYMDAASFVFFFLTVTFYVRLAGGGSRLYAIGFLIAAFLFITSKLQHTILAPFMVAFFFADPALRREISWKALAASGVVLLGTAYAMFQHVPEDYKGFAAYNVIFGEILPNSNDPVQSLAQMNLPPEMVTLKGTDAFAPNSGFRNPQFRPVLLKYSTHTTLLRYYLNHPDTAWYLISLALTASAYEREPGYGNFTRDSGKPARATSSAFAVISDLRSRAFKNRPLLYATYLLALSLGILWLAIRKWNAVFFPTLLILACAYFEFFVSALGDCRETTRHLFLFRAMMDLLLITIVAAVFLPRSEKVSWWPFAPGTKQSMH